MGSQVVGLNYWKDGFTINCHRQVSDKSSCGEKFLGFEIPFGFPHHYPAYRNMPYCLDYKTHFPPKICKEMGQCNLYSECSLPGGGRGATVEHVFVWLVGLACLFPPSPFSSKT